MRRSWQRLSSRENLQTVAYESQCVIVACLGARAQKAALLRLQFGHCGRELRVVKSSLNVLITYQFGQLDVSVGGPAIVGRLGLVAQGVRQGCGHFLQGVMSEVSFGREVGQIEAWGMRS